MRSTTRGTLLASHVFVFLTPTHITSVKQKEKKRVVLSVLHLVSLLLSVS